MELCDGECSWRDGDTHDSAGATTHKANGYITFPFDPGGIHDGVCFVLTAGGLGVIPLLAILRTFIGEILVTLDCSQISTWMLVYHKFGWHYATWL